MDYSKHGQKADPDLSLGTGETAKLGGGDPEWQDNRQNRRYFPPVLPAHHC